MRTLSPSTQCGNDIDLESWFRLISLEPGLCELARRASNGGTPADFTKITEQLARFVGPSARRERLRGFASYQSARDYLRGLFDHPAPRRLRGVR